MFNYELLQDCRVWRFTEGSDEMDVIDTTLRMGSREKLHPKHGYDEEVSGLTAPSLLSRLRVGDESVNISWDNYAAALTRKVLPEH